MKRLLLIMPIIPLIFAGCARQELGPQAYAEWVKNAENGLRVSKQVGENEFTLQYKPAAYEVLLHDHAPASQAALDEAVKPLEELQYFTLCIRTAERKDPAEASALDEADRNNRLNYLMFDMQADFALVDGKDTLPCVFYHYERNYNLSPENNILLGFEQLPGKAEQAADKTLIYTDQLLGSGPVQITIKAEDIQRIPRLKITP